MDKKTAEDLNQMAWELEIAKVNLDAPILRAGRTNNYPLIHSLDKIKGDLDKAIESLDTPEMKLARELTKDKCFPTDPDLLEEIAPREYDMLFLTALDGESNLPENVMTGPGVPTGFRDYLWCIAFGEFAGFIEIWLSIKAGGVSTWAKHGRTDFLNNLEGNTKGLFPFFVNKAQKMMLRFEGVGKITIVARMTNKHEFCGDETIGFIDCAAPLKPNQT